LVQQHQSAEDVIFAMLQYGNSSQVERFTTILSSMWKSRNLIIWQQTTKTNSSILERAKHLLEDWRDANRPQNARAAGTRHNSSSSSATAGLQSNGTSD